MSEKEVKEDASDYSDHSVEDTGSSGRTTLYVFNDVALHPSKLIEDDNKVFRYFVEFNALSSPFAILHRGGEKSGPVLGEMTKDKLSHHFNFTIEGGPPQQLDTESKLFRAKHTWTMAAQPNIDLQWRRTHGKDVKEEGGSSRRLFNLKLVDNKTDEVVALFVSTRWSATKCGKFLINNNSYERFGKGWEEAVVFTAMALHEKQRRKNIAGAAGGGGASVG